MKQVADLSKERELMLLKVNVGCAQRAEIALRREKPSEGTITSSSSDVSKMGSDDEDEITLAKADAIDTVFPTLKRVTCTQSSQTLMVPWYHQVLDANWGDVEENDAASSPTLLHTGE